MFLCGFFSLTTSKPEAEYSDFKRDAVNILTPEIGCLQNCGCFFFLRALLNQSLCLLISAWLKLHFKRLWLLEQRVGKLPPRIIRLESEASLCFRTTYLSVSFLNSFMYFHPLHTQRWQYVVLQLESVSTFTSLPIPFSSLNIINVKCKTSKTFWRTQPK